MATQDPKTLATNATQMYQEGDFENAARLFGEAASAFQAEDNALDAAEMKNNQSVAFLQSGDASASYQAAHGTAEVFLAADDFRRTGMARSNEATALETMGRQDEAVEIYRQAADDLQKAGEDQLRATVMMAVAGIKLRKFKIMDALLAMHIGLSGVKQPTLKQKIMLGMLKFRAW
jgi:tetratricopeptide (TPR) repeat protein